MYDDLWGVWLFIDEDLRGVCMFIVSKVVDKDYTDTFRGTIFILVHPTRFGNNFRSKKIGKILSFLIYGIHIVDFPFDPFFCDNYRFKIWKFFAAHFEMMFK